MLKLFLHTLMILWFVGLVAGGVYLFVQNGGVNLIGEAQASGFSHAGTPPGGALAQPSSAGFSQGQTDHRGPDSAAGFSLAGLSGVLVQAGKIAAITAFVLAVEAVMRLFKRRHKAAIPTGA